MVLQLNEKEKETLKQVLRTYEKDLKGEILKTDDRGLKAVLHEEEDVLRGLLKRVA
ncbi:MAG TPA: hypothetical protein VED67_04535 [Thermodesulfovibrionales bacterium]|nr:hypothetical protein [Thermodesulfovibrionales bacterium]